MTRTTWRKCLVAAAVLVAARDTAVAQSRAATDMVERYTRAAAIQAQRKDRWILNNALVPHWIGESDQLWYRKQTAAGQRYVVVDARTAAKSDLFDHARLADALAKETGKPADPNNLSLTAVHVGVQRDISFRFRGKSWRFTADGALSALTEPPGGGLVSPDRKKSVTLEGGNLWIRDLSTGARTQLTTDAEPYYSYADLPDATGRHAIQPLAIWSPDSRKLLTIQTDDRKTGELPVVDYAPAGSLRPRVIMKHTTLPGDETPTTFRILAIDVATGRQTSARYPLLPVTRMMDTPIDGGRAWWSADSRIAYFIDLERGERAAHVVRFDPETGQTQVVMTEQTDTFLELGSDVYAPVAVRYLPTSNQLIWYSERTGSAHLYLYDLATGQLVRPLTTGPWRVRDMLRVDEKRRQAFITISGRVAGKNPYYREVARVDLDQGGITVLSDQDGEHQPIVPGSTAGNLDAFYEILSGGDATAITAFSPSGDYFVETVTAPDRGGETTLRDRDGKVVTILETADVSRIPKWWRWPEPMTFKAADDTTELRGLLFRPSTFDPSKKYPIIDLVYGGPQTAFTPRGFAQSSYLDAASLAELGFIVLMVDGRGTAFRNRAFMTASYGRIQNASFDEDHIAAVKQLGRRYRYADTTRVGTHGFSGGGLMAARLMLGHPEFYQVGVAGDGNFDQRLFYSTWGERYHGLVSGNNYDVQDLTKLARQLKGKLLLYHGGVDFGVNPAAMFRLVQALMDANKDFDLQFYPRSAHQTPSYGLRRNWDYFVRHLGGLEPPREFTVTSDADYLLAENAGEN
jgi:dipeptidyl aminopeptidase/acylaminoacyl peptidase